MVPVSPSRIVTAPAVPGPRENAVPFPPVSSALRNIVLGAFLLYCLFAAFVIWIITAISKDTSQIFLTFGLWFASPPHFFENLIGLFTCQDGIFLRWFRNWLVYAGSIALGSTLICEQPSESQRSRSRCR